MLCKERDYFINYKERWCPLITAFGTGKVEIDVEFDTIQTFVAENFST